MADLESWKHNFHGHVIWPKGFVSLKVDSLHDKLRTTWKDIGKWGVTSIGKGFYEFSFSCFEDVHNVSPIASWNLNFGIIKLHA